jgi:hypothetical protein
MGQRFNSEHLRFIGPAMKNPAKGRLAAQKRGPGPDCRRRLTSYGVDGSPSAGNRWHPGTRRWMDIVDVVQRLTAGKHPEPVYHLPDAPTVGVMSAAWAGRSSGASST